MKKTILTDIIASLFILLFVYAAVSKLIDFQKFRVQLGQSPLLTSFAGWVAWMVPTVEITTAILLITSSYRLIGLYASFSLMTMFSAYIIAITKFSQYVPCSCGGILSKMNWNQHLIFNIAFVALSVVATINASGNKDSNNSSKIISTPR